MTRDVAHVARVLRPLDFAGVTVRDAAYRVLQLPAVADKTFLVTIGDRTVGDCAPAIRWSARGRYPSPMPR